jgi:hypothetical protein
MEEVTYNLVCFYLPARLVPGVLFLLFGFKMVFVDVFKLATIMFALHWKDINIQHSSNPKDDVC